MSIIDRIDQLVDQSLQVGPVDDYNADRYDKCPHCSRHWHGLPVTERIAAMYRSGRFDDSYTADGDTTRVLCRGSDFIGPMPHEQYGPGGIIWYSQRVRWYGGPGPASPAWLTGMIDDTHRFAAEVCGLPHVPDLSGWHRIGYIRDDDGPEITRTGPQEFDQVSVQLTDRQNITCVLETP